MLRRIRIATDARLALFDRDVLLAYPETRDLANDLLVDLDRLSGTADQFDSLRVACGEVLERVRFPVSNITKVAFGGSDHRTAFATTARHLLSEEKLARQPLAGALFAFPVGVAGIPCPQVVD